MRGDHGKIAGGVLLAAIGLGAAMHATTQFALGSIAAPGPGLFPAALSVLLTGLGVAIMAQGILAGVTTRVAIDWRTLLAILAGIVAFGIAIQPLGLVPAIVLTILSARLADRRLPLHRALLLAAAVSLLACLIFVVWLGSAMVVFRSPF